MKLIKAFTYLSCASLFVLSMASCRSSAHHGPIEGGTAGTPPRNISVTGGIIPTSGGTSGGTAFGTSAGSGSAAAGAAGSASAGSAAAGAAGSASAGSAAAGAAGSASAGSAAAGAAGSASSGSAAAGAAGSASSGSAAAGGPGGTGWNILTNCPALVIRPTSGTPYIVIDPTLQAALVARTSDRDTICSNLNESSNTKWADYKTMVQTDYRDFASLTTNLNNTFTEFLTPTSVVRNPSFLVKWARAVNTLLCDPRTHVLPSTHDICRISEVLDPDFLINPIRTSCPAFQTTRPAEVYNLINKYQQQVFESTTFTDTQRNNLCATLSGPAGILWTTYQSTISSTFPTKDSFYIALLKGDRRILDVMAPAGDYLTRIAAAAAIPIPARPVCGNSHIEPGETCDDGNTTPGDGCSNLCRTEPGYDCSGATCVRLPPVCGNGILETGEDCDDGDGATGNGCSHECRIESGYRCDIPGTRCTSTLPADPCYTYAFVHGNEILEQNTCGGGSGLASLPDSYSNIRHIQYSSDNSRIAFIADDRRATPTQRLFIGEIQEQRARPANINTLQTAPGRFHASVSWGDLPIWNPIENGWLTIVPHVTLPTIAGSPIESIDYQGIMEINVDRATTTTSSVDFLMNRLLDRQVFFNEADTNMINIHDIDWIGNGIRNTELAGKIIMVNSQPYITPSRNKIINIFDKDPPTRNPDWVLMKPILEILEGSTELQNITGINADEVAVSPNGQKLAFTRDGVVSVCNLELSGRIFNTRASMVLCTHSKPLFEQGNSSNICWSSDSRKIFLEYTESDNPPSIVMIDGERYNAFVNLTQGTSPGCPR